MSLITINKGLSEADTKTLACELSTMSQMIGTLTATVGRLRNDIEEVKDRIDAKLKLELDNVQRRYINMLEGKLVQFDEEASKLKGEKELEYHRLHGYFYSSKLPK